MGRANTPCAANSVTVSSVRSSWSISPKALTQWSSFELRSPQTDRTTSVHVRTGRTPILVLQLHFISSSVAYGGGELVCAPPVGPGPDEGGTGSGGQQQFGDQRADFRHRQCAGQSKGGPARCSGLVLSRLPKALRRCSADSFARNAAAAMTRLICRCQPCQERASQ